MKRTFADRPVYGFACLQRAYVEALDTSVIGVSAASVGVTIVVFAVLGPMGMEDNLGTMRRLAFVGLCGIVCWPLCHSLSAAILFLMRKRPPFQIVVACAAGVWFMAVPCTAVAYTINGLFDPVTAIRDELSEIYWNVLVMFLACSGVVHYVACQRVELRQAVLAQTFPTRRRSGKTEDAEEAQDSTSTEDRDNAHGRFFDRVPSMLGQDVVYLNVSGHYINVINVVTTKGSCLVLMRFADAVVALGDVGMQVHRSYWVAHRHINATLRRDDRMLIRVTGPHEVPVSRSHLARVKAAIPTKQRLQQVAATDPGTTEDA